MSKTQLILGTNDKRSSVYIQDENRKKHMVVLGTKGSGKSTMVLPLLAKQDIENKKVGATIVTGDKEMSMLLYSLARRNGRDVRIVKPSLTDSGKILLHQSDYQYTAIKEDVVDFEQAIRKREIVIIDMEFAAQQEKAIQGVAYLLHAFREAYLHENEHKDTPHYLYVDDSHLYFPYVMPILMNGGEYGVGCTLFLESRQLLTPLEKAYVDAAVRNKLVLSGLTIEDAKFVSEEMYERQLTYILNRDKQEFIYATTEAKGRRTNGVGKFTPLDEELLSSLRLSVPRHRGNIERMQTGVHEFSEPFEKESVKEVSLESKQILPSEKSEAKSDEPTPVPNREVAPVKPEVKKSKVKAVMPEQRQRERITKTIQKEVKRHVVILDDLFGDDDEY